MHNANFLMLANKSYFFLNFSDSSFQQYTIAKTFPILSSFKVSFYLEHCFISVLNVPML